MVWRMKKTLARLAISFAIGGAVWWFVFNDNDVFAPAISPLGGAAKFGLLLYLLIFSGAAYATLLAIELIKTGEADD